MEAMTSYSARRVRALAVVAVLLCGFTAIAPMIAHTTGAQHQRIHVVKVLGAAVADQHASTLRLDQPGATFHRAHANASAVYATTSSVSLTPSDDNSVVSSRTRGPPTSAL